MRPVLVETAAQVTARAFLRTSVPTKYSYHFTWCGRPIIQYPADIVAIQQIIWQVQPDLIIETGVAHGGSVILSASMLELNALSGGPKHGRVIGIDVGLKPENEAAIVSHPLGYRVVLLKGCSVTAPMLAKVRWAMGDVPNPRVLVLLDSLHTHEHVLAELNLYAPLVSVGSYCVVFDTFIADQPDDAYPDRPWGPGNNPHTAVQTFLATHPEFQPDTALDATLLVSTARGGYLKRVA